MSYKDEIKKGLPTVNLDLFTTLYDAPPPGRKYTRSATVNLDPETYGMLQDLASHRDLPFNGSVSALLRHAVAAGIDSLAVFMSQGNRSLRSVMKQQEMSLTTQRYARAVEDQVALAVDELRFWTSAREWSAVRSILDGVVANLRDYPVAAWQSRAAKEWLQNKDVKRLLEEWREEMASDDPGGWVELVNVWKELEGLARV